MNAPFLKQLFDADQPDTGGKRVVRFVFEGFVVAATIYLAGMWGEFTLRISDVVLPLGIARYMDISFLHGNTLPLWNAGLITALVLAGFFRWGRWPYAAAFVLLLFQYAARFSLGEIPHSANMAGMALLGYAMAGLMFDKALERGRFAMGFVWFFLGLGYSLAAVCKLIARGFVWADGRHLWMWINEKTVDQLSKTGIYHVNWLQEWALADHTMATLFLAFGFVSEFFAFLVWWRRFRMPMAMAILGLHMGIYMTMNIMFILSVYELLILGLPLAWMIDRLLPGVSIPRFLDRY